MGVSFCCSAESRYWIAVVNGFFDRALTGEGAGVYVVEFTHGCFLSRAALIIGLPTMSHSLRQTHVTLFKDCLERRCQVLA